jgi:chromate reductase, NAD(P)H dehydrogenase (quinone)
MSWHKGIGNSNGLLAPPIPRRQPRCAYGDSVWDDKTVAVMGASVGTLGTARVQYQLRQVFVFLNMHALNRPEVMISNAALRFDAQGHLTDTTIQDLIRQLLRNLLDWTRQLREPVVKT